MNKGYQLYLFDVSSTLVDDTRAIYEADKKLLKSLETVFPGFDINKKLEKKGMSPIESLSKKEYHAYKNTHDSWKHYYRSFDVPEDDLETVGEMFLGFYFEEVDKVHERQNIVPFDDSEEVLRKIKYAGKKIGLITLIDTKSVEQLARRYGWIDIIDWEYSFPYDKVEQGYHKPNPHPILLAKEQAEIEDAKNILFVGDSMEDYLAGTTAGVSTRIIRRDSRFDFDIPEGVDARFIKSLRELLE